MNYHIFILGFAQALEHFFREAKTKSSGQSSRGLQTIPSFPSVCITRYSGRILIISIQAVIPKLAVFVDSISFTENGEGLQILHYEVGQKYEPHFDYFMDEYNTQNGGQRIATVLMYLCVSLSLLGFRVYLVSSMAHPTIP